MGGLLSGAINTILQRNALYITSGWGWRTYTIDGRTVSDFHKGLDVRRWDSTSLVTKAEYVTAMQWGKVTAIQKNVAGYSETYPLGNFVTLSHGNGYKTRYCHMRCGSVLVNLGDVVCKGQTLGYMGSTGYSSGFHLHFAVFYNNNETNPTPFLTGQSYIPQVYAITPSKTFYPYTAKVISNTLLVKSGPSDAYDTVQTLVLGNTIIIYSKRNLWGSINAGNSQFVKLAGTKKFSNSV